MKPFPYAYNNKHVIQLEHGINQEEDEPLDTVNEVILDTCESFGYDISTIAIDWRDENTVWLYNPELEEGELL